MGMSCSTRTPTYDAFNSAHYGAVFVSECLVAPFPHFCQAHLDVVEVDFSQAAVIVVDSFQSLLHVGGVGWLVREDLERIWFYHTCRKPNILIHKWKYRG